MPQPPHNPLTLVDAAPPPKKPSGDKVLTYSFIASVLLNFGWMFWVGQSQAFSSTRPFTDLHGQQFRIYKPVLVKPRPKPLKKQAPPPPPVTPKIRQTFRPLRPVVHSPRLTPRVTRTPPVQTHPVPLQSPPVQSAPVPVAQSHTAQPRHEIRMAMRDPETTHLATHDFTPARIQPPVNLSTGLQPPVTRQPEIKQPEPRQPEVHQPETKQPDVQQAVVRQPETRQPEMKQPEAKQAEYKKPGWKPVDSQEAATLSEYASPEVSDEDGVAGKTVEISWTVNEKGRAENVRVTQHSGNADVDRKCVEIIRNMRFQPAIQDHYFQEAHMNHEFGF